MTERVRHSKVSFTYTLRGAGWARASLAIGDDEIELLASYLTDALGDLIRASAALARGATHVTVPWVEEPGSNEWIFEQTDTIVRVRVNHHRSLSPRRDDNSGEPRFDAECRTRDLCSAVARSAQLVLDELGIDGYREQWKAHAFPAEPLAALHALLAAKLIRDDPDTARSRR